MFPPEVVTAVLEHMNGDHTDDSLLIVRAHGAPGAIAATMSGLDADGGTWTWSDGAGAAHELAIAWPSGAIEERAEIRREVVALYRAACERLGVAPREH